MLCYQQPLYFQLNTTFRIPIIPAILARGQVTSLDVIFTPWKLFPNICHDFLKSANLLHKRGFVDSQMSGTLTTHFQNVYI